MEQLTINQPDTETKEQTKPMSLLEKVQALIQKLEDTKIDYALLEEEKKKLEKDYIELDEQFQALSISTQNSEGTIKELNEKIELLELEIVSLNDKNANLEINTQEAVDKIDLALSQLLDS
ncbi:MAG TPA: hypothetical protein PL063_02660 [Candidatus Cloacimonadota bacterium]|jgi:chromosome segregation ATPase|nr:hypothetical protein [Candidatus Cloacimonadales bacterium]HPY96096.1 hypothetical protein [Candidatus Cloacimonadota bacterium]HQB40736.1 hypothetical protein [Candidatus Cloacimonadota bacterium]